MRTITEIQSDIDGLMPTWVRGAARFESAGVSGLTMFDCQRKVLLSQLAAAHLKDVEAAGGKQPTEKVLEAFTHSQPSYVAFIENAFDERVKYLECNAWMIQLRGELALAEVRGEVQAFE